MIRRLRLFMCRWFSYHDTVCILEKFKGEYELHKCKYCGLEAAVHHETQKVLLLSWR